MFGRMMNSFYYGKSGKGDYKKEDLKLNVKPLKLGIIYIKKPSIPVLILPSLSLNFIVNEKIAIKEQILVNQKLGGR